MSMASIVEQTLMFIRRFPARSADYSPDSGRIDSVLPRRRGLLLAW
jgi:hypothetical protein